MDLRIMKGENEEQYIWRLGQAKDSGELDLDWAEIADLINKEFRTDESEYRTESAYRKCYQQAKRFYEANVFGQYKDNSYVNELVNAKHELRKEKQKLFDERTSLNRVLREQGRRESLVETLMRVIDDYEPNRFEYVYTSHGSSNNDLIIHLTDIHVGVEINSPLNVFNSEVLKDRLHKYLDQIIEIRNLYNSECAYVVLGGDIIHGLIHVNARIEAKENVIEQVMTASDLISSFLFELSKHFKHVEVHSTAGNHGRVTANKDESVTNENFDLLVPYICKKELKNIENVSFAENYLGCDIANFIVRGHSIYCSHGDKDSAINVVRNMTNFARLARMQLPDLCLLGHRHSNGLTTVDGVKVIESGCVDGMDQYAINQRLVGVPEQTVTIVTEDNVVKALCNIQLI